MRIRGKLGQLSRTELVALALKQKHQDEMRALLAQSEQFELQAAKQGQDNELLRQAELHRAALDAMPAALLVCDEEGSICYANPRLEALFGYGAGTLVGQLVTTLIPERMRHRKGQSITNPHPVRLGGDEAVYARRKNGTEFRVVVLLDSVATTNGPITTCIVRDFVTEVESRRRFFTERDDRSHVN